MLLPQLDQLLQYGRILLKTSAEESLLHEKARARYAAFARDWEKMRVFHRDLQPVRLVLF